MRDRDKVTEGCYLGDMEDKRDTREIFGRAANHWAFVNRDCGARQSTLAPFPTGPLAVFGSDLARLVFEDCAYVKSYYEAARKANRAGDGCRIAHRPPSLSEPDESLRVVLGDALLGHWLAACLGEDFAPFLGRVVPPLLEAASGNRLLVEKDDSDDDGEEGQYVIRTEALEEQCQACNLVLLLAEATGALFANYVPACLEALAPVAGSAMVGDVRAVALSALPALVGCANRAALAVGGDCRGPLLLSLIHI